MPVVRGTVVHCSRFGAVVRLEDGRLGVVPPDGPDMHFVRRAVAGGRRPTLPFEQHEERGRRVRLSLAQPPPDDNVAHVPAPASSSLEQKIIDYLRQTAEWDPRVGSAESPRGDAPPRADRLLPFEFRARRQYRDSPERPRRPKR